MSRTLWIVVIAATAAAVATGANAGRTHATLSGPFIGTWTAKLTADEAIDRGDARMAGRFRLVIRTNGTYTTDNPLDPAATGRVQALSNHRLRFSRDQGCEYTGDIDKPGGVYRWSRSGNRLTIRLITEGPCTGRTQSLTYPVWTKR